MTSQRQDVILCCLPTSNKTAAKISASHTLEGPRLSVIINKIFQHDSVKFIFFPPALANSASRIEGSPPPRIPCTKTQKRHQIAYTVSGPCLMEQSCGHNLRRKSFYNADPEPDPARARRDQ